MEICLFFLQLGFVYRHLFHHGRHRVPQILHRIVHRSLACAADWKRDERIAQKKPVSVGCGTWRGKGGAHDGGSFSARQAHVPSDGAGAHVPQCSLWMRKCGEQTEIPDHIQMARLQSAH